MAEQTFADDEQQLVVRLSDDTLAYIPAPGPGVRGWQCKLDQIGWTSARVTSRGIQEVNLHNRQGRVAVTLMPFSGIERFYHSLLRHLVRQTFFGPVRESLPDQIPALERALWLCAQTEESDGAWQVIQIERDGAVVATERGLMLMPTRDHELERIPWRHLAAFREVSYGDLFGVRFYLVDRFLEVGLPELKPELRDYCSRRMNGMLEEHGQLPTFQIPGVRARDPELLMEFPRELTALRDLGALTPEEEVLAYARGIDNTGSDMELVLTTARLIRRDLISEGAFTGERMPETTPVDALPRFRREEGLIRAGTISLQTDTDLHPEMAPRFLEGYRMLLSDTLSPFSPDENPQRELCAIPIRILPGRDPFNLESSPAAV